MFRSQVITDLTNKDIDVTVRCFNGTGAIGFYVGECRTLVVNIDKFDLVRLPDAILNCVGEKTTDELKEEVEKLKGTIEDLKSDIEQYEENLEEYKESLMRDNKPL